MFFLQNLYTMNILDLIFLLHIVSTIFARDLPVITIIPRKPHKDPHYFLRLGW